MPREISINSENTLITIRKTLAESCGVATYKWLLDNLDLENEKYRTAFCNFYNVVGRSGAWRNAFFEVFIDCKNLKDNGNEVSIRTILQKLHEKDDIENFEISFATKMLAMLDTSKPIVDKFVKKHCELNFLNGGVFEARLENAVEQYEILEQLYKEFMNTENAANTIREFDSTFPEYTDISAVKKIDFLIMWKEKFNS